MQQKQSFSPTQSPSERKYASSFNMKVSAGEGVKSCGIQTSLWTWESHAVRRFRFPRAVDVATKQVGMFSLCYVFICFCNHSSRSRTERDKFVFGCFYRSTAWELRSLSAWEFYHDLTHRRFRGARRSRLCHKTSRQVFLNVFIF